MPAPTSDEQRQRLLAEALQLSRYLLNRPEAVDPDWVERRQDRLRQLQKALKAFAHPIQRKSLAPVEMPLEVRQAFVKAVLLVTRYQQVGGCTWQGTLASPTLSQYCPDPVPTKWVTSDAITSLCRYFDLQSDIQTELTDLLTQVDIQIDRQRQIIAAVLAEAGFSSAGVTAAPDQVVTLFQKLFGAIPIPPEVIDCVYTDMQIYFCLNYQDGKLYQQDPNGHHDCIGWYSFTESDRTQLQGFLQSLGEFSFEKFRRFPIFGACDPTIINQEWCDRLAQQIGVPTSLVIQALVRSVSIIPTQKAEAFLMHDIWGHHWQFMLTQFERDYTILADCHKPLRAAETAYTPEGPLTCRELFIIEGEQISVDEERSYLFFHGEVQQRLGLLFTHLIGEMLADIAEFKFIWKHTELSDQLPSSSLFKTEPTKLDLSLNDIDILFLQVLKPLLEMEFSVLKDSLLETELLAEWTEDNYPTHSLEFRTSLKQAIVRLYQIFLEEYNNTYLPTMTGEIGIFTQAVSNLLYLQNAVSELYTDPIVNANPDLPFQDLLLVFVSSYCSSDSYADFWDVDDVLANYFLPCWQRLQQFVV
ncbi:hypothetical protein H6G89_07770 [Oscillatoria sp. FACHB-1407]|uniref:hypothetical protein n=1 Tax=Oscillatoria sp. FACHB-1407 TaxID=2692847 RepID=UPI00168695F6|nr:hypothetical protein [Oscillatoria sp. FACHB-1407]MBD2460940.1 hypothetical protein [Oscillatoria sp. FACHB-1407]